MNKLEQAARQALEVLEKGKTHIDIITPLREALAEQTEQEPVAWVDKERTQSIAWLKAAPEHGTKLYTAPVRTKDLTDDEIRNALYGENTLPGLMNGIRAVIAADREKNK